MTTAATWFNGPQVNVGTPTGTWLVIGSIVVTDSVADSIFAAIPGAAPSVLQSCAAGGYANLAISRIVTNPSSGLITIQGQAATTTTGSILSPYSFVTAIRIG
jgi:hypothetical protein